MSPSRHAAAMRRLPWVFRVPPLRWLAGACLLASCFCHGVSLAAAELQASDTWQAWLNQDGVVQGIGLTIMQQEYLQRSQDELLHQLQAPPLFTALALRHDRLLALRPDGSVYGFGDNDLGMLGLGVAERRRRPVAPGDRFFSAWVQRLRLLHGVLGAQQLTMGGGHNMALLEDGALCAWGANDAGQLGARPPQPIAPRLVPWKVAGLPALTAAAAGDDHSLALDRQGQVWGWGLNNMGQLGDGTRNNRYRPQTIPGLGGVIAIAAGAGHSLALDRQGRVWSWGGNARGQLGRPTGRYTFARKPALVAGLPAVAAVAADGDVSAALGRDGAVWWWGGRLERLAAVRQAPWELHRLVLMGRAASVVAFEKGLVITDEQNKVWLFTEPYERPPRLMR